MIIPPDTRTPSEILGRRSRNYRAGFVWDDGEHPELDAATLGDKRAYRAAVEMGSAWPINEQPGMSNEAWVAMLTRVLK